MGASSDRQGTPCHPLILKVPGHRPDDGPLASRNGDRGQKTISIPGKTTPLSPSSRGDAQGF
jgi:hypothetical protein